MKTVRNEKELASSLKNGDDTIIIEGDLCNKVIRIKATGTAAWIIAVGAIGVAVVAVMSAPATGGTSTIVSAFTGTAAAGILGTGTAVSAGLIAVAAGGVGVLNSLRDYKIAEKTPGRVVLKK